MVGFLLYAQELETLQKELEALTPHPINPPILWLSATDQEQEGVWLDYYTGERLENYTKPWYPGHDTRYGNRENCLRYYTHTPADMSWGESHCSVYGVACPCQYSRSPMIILRGACPNSKIDKTYRPKQLASTPNDLMLFGLLATRIQFNNSSSQWKLTDARSSVTAVSRATKLSYVLGKHEWTVTGDVLDCHKGQPYTTYLKLSGCRSNDQFTCSNGQCVTMEERCNQVPNCKDQSDEVDCKLLFLKKNYNSKVPPIVPTGGSNFHPTQVEISISLLKIVGMEEVQHKIHIQFEISLEWKENRATYHNLKDETSLNALTDEEIGALWLPYVVYDNTDMKEAVQLFQGNVKTTIVVTREGSFTRSGYDFVDETEIFNGKYNTLVMSQTYTKSFQCIYNLQKYPFDT